MAGQLHQLNIEFQAAEDRLVLKANTTDKQEMRLWLTRRFTKQLWDSLQQILQQSPELVKQQADPETRKAMLAFEQEKSVKREQFEKDYEDEAEGFPLGEAPVLLTGFGYTPPKDREPARIALRTEAGHEIGLPVNEHILLSLAKLLQQVMPSTGWDLRLEIGYKTDEAPAAGDASKVH